MNLVIHGLLSCSTSLTEHLTSLPLLFIVPEHSYLTGEQQDCKIWHPLGCARLFAECRKLAIRPQVVYLKASLRGISPPADKCSPNEQKLVGCTSRTKKSFVLFRDGPGHGMSEPLTDEWAAVQTDSDKGLQASWVHPQMSQLSGSNKKLFLNSNTELLWPVLLT